MGLSEAFHNLCGLQSPASLRVTASAGARQAQPWFLYVLRCPCPVIAKLENWGEEAGLTQREEQGLSEEGVKDVELKLYSKEMKVFYPGKGFYGNLSLFEI